MHLLPFPHAIKLLCVDRRDEKDPRPDLAAADRLTLNEKFFAAQRETEMKRISRLQPFPADEFDSGLGDIPDLDRRHIAALVLVQPKFRRRRNRDPICPPLFAPAKVAELGGGHSRDLLEDLDGKLSLMGENLHIPEIVKIGGSLWYLRENGLFCVLARFAVANLSAIVAK
jgi:hypothetical protein